MSPATRIGCGDRETVAVSHQTFHPCDAHRRPMRRDVKVKSGNSLRLSEHPIGNGQGTCTTLRNVRTSSAATGFGVSGIANLRNRYLFLSDLLLLAAAPFLAYAIP